MVNNKIIVKISPGYSQDILLKRMGDSIYNNIEFHPENDVKECDFWAITHDFKYNGCAVCPPENVIFITGEPPSVKRYSKKFLKQFGIVISSQDSLPHHNVINTHQLLTWTFDKTYDELSNLQPFEKSKSISIVSSNKRFSREHEQRYQFAISLKKQMGDNIDLFGRGIHDFHDKWDVLAPYKFSIAIENSCNHNYITEKLTECFLSYTFPLYYGCPNVDDYYPKGSYEWIDITDFDGSLELIHKISSDNTYYQKHLNAICEARKIYLEKYDYYPLLSSIINGLNNGLSDYNNKKLVNINHENITINDIIFKIRCIKSIAKNIIYKLDI